MRVKRPAAAPYVTLAEGPRTGPSYVVYRYGHGGGGVSLSWGCARNVADLVATHAAAIADGELVTAG